MSGLDDSLSDVGAKKKYPFELEKAIHNVMFIQHHMQRQDEFNAVSGSEHAITTQNHLFCFFESCNLRKLRWENSWLLGPLGWFRDGCFDKNLITTAFNFPIKQCLQ